MILWGWLSPIIHSLLKIWILQSSIIQSGLIVPTSCYNQDFRAELSDDRRRIPIPCCDPGCWTPTPLSSGLSQSSAMCERPHCPADMAWMQHHPFASSWFHGSVFLLASLLSAGCLHIYCTCPGNSSCMFTEICSDSSKIKKNPLHVRSSRLLQTTL